VFVNIASFIQKLKVYKKYEHKYEHKLSFNYTLNKCFNIFFNNFKFVIKTYDIKRFFFKSPLKILRNCTSYNIYMYI